MLLLLLVNTTPVIVPPPVDPPTISVIFARPAITLTPYRSTRRTGRAYDYQRRGR